MKVLNALIKNKLLLLFCFSLISFYLFYQIGTSIFIPDNDLRAHSAYVVQALMAINEGQFPIRVAPWEYQGLRYPEFQFYGVIFFTIAGYLYKILQNPLLSLKCLLFFALTMSGFYVYRLTRLFVKSDAASMVASIAYLFSPFLLLNLSYRGDFPEAFGQAILPIALFYSFRILLSHNKIFCNFIMATIFWFILLTSHLITFAYGTLFFVLTCLVFLYQKQTKLKNFMISLSANAYAWLLGAWFVVPIVLLSSLTDIVSHSEHGLRMTSFYNLFTLHFNGSVVSQYEPGFYAAVGWPFLFGFVYCACCQLKQKNIACFVVLFSLALLFAWSGINFWALLPKFFSFGKTGFRFLTQIMWLGAILLAFSLDKIFSTRFTFLKIIIVITLIISINSVWLIKQTNGEKIANIKQSPEIFYGSHDYLLKSEKIKPQIKYDISFLQAQADCMQKSDITQCKITNKYEKMVQLPVFYYPRLLTVWLDGKKINYFASAHYVSENFFKQVDYNNDRDWMPYTLTTVSVPKGEHTIEVKVTGIDWANTLSVVAWLLLFLMLFLRAKPFFTKPAAIEF